MKTVITGGIGAGKSYVCRWLQARGTAIYDCDAAAKRLMRTSEPLQQALIRLVGKEVYDHAEARDPSRRRLNKAVLAYAKEHNIEIVENAAEPGDGDGEIPLNRFRLVFDCTSVGRETK